MYIAGFIAEADDVLTGAMKESRYRSESAVGKQRQKLIAQMERDLSLSRHLKHLTERLCL